MAFTIGQTARWRKAGKTMDRLHRKKRSFGQDNLDYWYLTPTISSADLVTAYKFIHAENAELALYNLNYDVIKAPYKLSKAGDGTNQNTITWEADSGYTIGYRQGKNPQMAGLENANLRGLAQGTIKSAIIRAELPTASQQWSGTGVSNMVQYITQPSNYFGLSRQYCTPDGNGYDHVSGGYAICTALSGNHGGEGYHAGARGFVLGGANAQNNRYAGLNEYVIVAGYEDKPKSKPSDPDVLQEANLSLYDGVYYQIDDEDHTNDQKTLYNTTTATTQHMIYGGKSSRYVFMSTDTYWINVKAAAFYNRYLTKQEHDDLVRMIWKI